jgi:hypothetical protein
MNVFDEVIGLENMQIVANAVAETIDDPRPIPKFVIAYALLDIDENGAMFVNSKTGETYYISAEV